MTAGFARREQLLPATPGRPVVGGIVVCDVELASPTDVNRVDHFVVPGPIG